MGNEPIDLSKFRTMVSGTAKGQREIASNRAASIIAQPLWFILRVLADHGLIGDGQAFVIPVTTPTQQITVTVEFKTIDAGGPT